ncbi:MAG TPA: cache domain-containing protein, partial [Spirochaetota bacterium]|nr:cache domain-containing protein [Spirochaetota bacterium]
MRYMLPSILARLRAYLLDLSIKNRLIVSLLTAIALPIITLTLYHAIAERHYLMERDLEAMRSHAREVAGQIDTIIDSNAATVRHMAMAWRLQYFFATRDYGGPWRASLQAWLDEQLKISPDYAALYALDLTGACIISSDRTFVGQNYSVRPYFKEALKGAHYISDWSIGLTSGVPGVYFSAPVRYNGAIVGIAVLKMKTDRITRIIDEFSDASSAAYLLNGMGIVLAHRNRELLYRSLGDLAPDERRCIEESQQFANRTIVSAGLPSMRDDHRGLLRAGERVAISRIYRLDGSDKVSAIARLRHLEWTVGISKHLSSVYGPAHRQIAIALVIALLSMGLGYIAGQAITRGITRPLSHLVDAVDAFGKGEWAIRAPVYAGDELGGLATTFNEMASALGKHTNNLEALVAERTGELQAKNEKVLSQQKDLQRRNDLIEAELSIA